MTRDHRELVIEELTQSEAVLIDELVERTIERNAERLVKQQAIHALADLQRRHDRLGAQHHRLIKEYRALRFQVMFKAVAA